jgi:hypothetical protein
MSEPDDRPERGVTDGIRRNLVRAIFAFFLFYWIALSGTLIAVYIWPRPRGSLLTSIVHNHFPVVVGLPTSMLMCFCVVWLLRATEGNIELEIWVFKFRGAAAPIILWIVAFFAMALAIKMLW